VYVLTRRVARRNAQSARAGRDEFECCVSRLTEKSPTCASSGSSPVTFRPYRGRPSARAARG